MVPPLPDAGQGRPDPVQEEHLKDEDFADMYAEKGRPAIPPSYMISLILIQMRQNWSNSEVLE